MEDDNDLEKNQQAQTEVDFYSTFKVNGNNWYLMELLSRLDTIDKKYSNMLQEISDPRLESILFIPAHHFNRTYGVTLSILSSFIVGCLKYNQMLENLGF